MDINNKNKQTVPKETFFEASNVTGFMKTVPIGTRNEIQFITDY